MPEYITIDVDLTDVQRRLQQMPGKLQRRVLRRVMRRGQEALHRQMVANAPVGETGQLAESIRVSIRRPDRYGITARVIANPPIPRRKRNVRAGKVGTGRTNSYAGFPEFGTVHQPAQKYARRALEQAGEKVIQETAQAMASMIDEALR